MYEAFRELLIQLVADMIAWISNMSNWLIETSLKIENALWISDNPLTATLISNIYRYIYFAVVTLMVLKFIWKGFQVYILWRDGDADVSPHNLVVGAVIAIVASLAFPALYDVGVSATVSIGDGIISTINENWFGKPEVFTIDNSEKALALWNQYFAAFDEDNDHELSLSEYDSFREWLLENEETYNEVNSIIPIKPNNLFRDYSLEALEDALDEASLAELSGALDNLNLAGVLALLIYFILYVMMYIKLLGRSAEMLFLRWGFPIAAIGYIDSDGGISHSYIQLIFRQMLTSILQVIALFLSFYIAIDFRLSHILMGIAVVGVAFRGPVLLAQIIAPQRQGAGFGQKLHTALMLRQLWRH